MRTADCSLLSQSHYCSLLTPRVVITAMTFSLHRIYLPLTAFFKPSLHHSTHPILFTFEPLCSANNRRIISVLRRQDTKKIFWQWHVHMSLVHLMLMMKACIVLFRQKCLLVIIRGISARLEQWGQLPTSGRKPHVLLTCSARPIIDDDYSLACCTLNDACVVASPSFAYIRTHTKHTGREAGCQGKGGGEHNKQTTRSIKKKIKLFR